MKNMENFIPVGLKPTDADLVKADAILSNSSSYLVRYLREEPTVGLAFIQPATTTAIPLIKQFQQLTDLFRYLFLGKTELPNAKPRKVKVICKGIPYACMISFIYGGKLHIGWSKRCDTKKVVENHSIHSLFESALKNATLDSEDYQEAFTHFVEKLVHVMTAGHLDDLEIPFSKRGGKYAAIIRGLLDTITVNGREARSANGNPLPSVVARSLRWYIPTAEKRYGMRAANVIHLPAAMKLPVF